MLSSTVSLLIGPRIIFIEENIRQHFFFPESFGDILAFAVLSDDVEMIIEFKMIVE